MFDFRIAGEERVHGRDAFLIEATPKIGREDAIWSAKLWLDRTRFQTLKCEIEGVPIDAYEEVLNDCVILNLKPIFLTTHEYGMERGGLRYPTKSKVRVAYPIAGSAPVDKISIRMSYDGYKYFSVASEPKILK